MDSESYTVCWWKRSLIIILALRIGLDIKNGKNCLHGNRVEWEISAVVGDGGRGFATKRKMV